MKKSWLKEVIEKVKKDDTKYIGIAIETEGGSKPESIANTMENGGKIRTTIDELLQDVPVDAVIGDNLIIAYSKINSNRYKKILCTISGGYDSDIMLDICVKCDRDKKIEYVYFDTGLEYQATKDHIEELKKKYDIEIRVRKAKVPIPVACRKYGLPFLSKRVSENIERLQRHDFEWLDEPFERLIEKYPKCRSALRWWCNEWGDNSQFNIKKNKYLKEFLIDNPPVNILISPKCCEGAKKGVLHDLLKEENYDLDIVGLRKAEGGARNTRFKSCFQERENDVDLYLPLWWYLEETKEIYKKNYSIHCSDCYTKYGLKRTGCAGCPFGQNFEQELETMKKYEPNLFRAANKIFGESYRYTRAYRMYVVFMDMKTEEDSEHE